MAFSLNPAAAVATRRNSFTAWGARANIPEQTCLRLLLLFVSILCVVQYGTVSVFGVLAPDLEVYYGLTKDQVDNLYQWMNFGACALSFIPGILYDKLGPSVVMVLATILGTLPVVLQLFWTEDFPAFLSTETGLTMCYVCFGLAASFFNVVGCFAPLQGFRKRDVGKVSAIVQVCLSLGLTFQTAVYSLIKGREQPIGGDYVNAYLIYVLLFNLVSGVLMFIVLQACKSIMDPPEELEAPLQVDERGATSPNTSFIGEEEEVISKKRAILRIARSPQFIFMSFFFLFPVGFSYSFLDVESDIAQQVPHHAVTASYLATDFGWINAFGRLITSFPLDYTNRFAYGGPFSYILASLIVFCVGNCFLVWPAANSAGSVELANELMALGYGGFMGMVPAALRLLFGTEFLGLIYGVLYFWVYLAVLGWGKVGEVPSSCVGVNCYHNYCLGGAVSTGLVTLLGVAMVHYEAKRRQDAEREKAVRRASRCSAELSRGSGVLLH